MVSEGELGWEGRVEGGIWGGSCGCAFGEGTPDRVVH